jgi:DNA repair photolyase
MRTLREAGVPAGVMMAPVLPGITDSTQSIEAVAAAARAHNAAYFSAVPLRLAPHVKEFYLGYIGEEHPDLLARYERAYPGTYAPKDYRDKLGERIERVRAEYGFNSHSARRANAPGPPPPARRGPQLMLPI